MRSDRSSLTALGTAAQRALEMERPSAERICSDTLARAFVPSWFYALMKRVSATAYAQRRAGGDLGFIVARCRFMDDLLTEALELGTRQLVILGAGFDTRAYRFGMLKDGVRVFEVDHPATQRNKRRKLERILGPGGVPEFVRFVPVDFTRQSLGARLAEAGYSETLKTLFLWEGVSMYLDAVSVDGTLAFVACHSAPGSAIAFDYQCPQRAATGRRDMALWFVTFLRRFFGEERSFAIDPAEIRSFLAGRAFRDVRSVCGDELHSMYFKDSNASRSVTSDYAIAVGTV